MSYYSGPQEWAPAREYRQSACPFCGTPPISTNVYTSTVEYGCGTTSTFDARDGRWAWVQETACMVMATLVLPETGVLPC